MKRKVSQGTQKKGCWDKNITGGTTIRKQGVIAGGWVVLCYTLLLSDLCRDFKGIIIFLLFLLTATVCGVILSRCVKTDLNKNICATCLITLGGWVLVVFTPLGGIFNYGFGNMGGFLPGNVLYFAFGLALIPVLLLSCLIAVVLQYDK